MHPLSIFHHNKMMSYNSQETGVNAIMAVAKNNLENS